MKISFTFFDFGATFILLTLVTVSDIVSHIALMLIFFVLPIFCLEVLSLWFYALWVDLTDLKKRPGIEYKYGHWKD